MQLSEFAYSTDEDFFEYLGVISEQQLILEKAASRSNGDQPWAKNVPIGIANMKVEEIAKVVNEIVIPDAKKDLREFLGVLRRVVTFGGKGAKVVLPPTDLKTVKSITSKIKRGKNLGRMHDIIRGTIEVRDPENMNRVHAAMKKQFRIYEREDKVLGGDKNYGYFGSVHYKVELRSGHIAEVQVMPRSLSNMKQAAHIIYDAEREKVKKDPNYVNTPEFKAVQQSSRALFQRGQGRKGVHIARGPNIRV